MPADTEFHTSEETVNTPIPTLEELGSAVTDYGVQIGALTLIFFMGKALLHLQRSVAKLWDGYNSLPTVRKSTYTLDTSTDAKKDIYYSLGKIKSDWAALGILSNGEVSEYGYHFSKVSWEFKNESSNHTIPKAVLELPPVETSIKLFDSYCDRENIGIISKGSGYYWIVSPIFVHNIIIAILVTGYADDPGLAQLAPLPEREEISKILKKMIKPTVKK